VLPPVSAQQFFITLIYLLKVESISGLYASFSRLLHSEASHFSNMQEGFHEEAVKTEACKN